MKSESAKTIAKKKKISLLSQTHPIPSNETQEENTHKTKKHNKKKTRTTPP
jgi:hypothetical protein